MRNLTILIDMDDTIEDLSGAWVEFLNKTHETSVSKDDINDWDMTIAFPNLSRWEVYQPLFTEDLWKKVKPLPGAVKYIEQLINDGHKVIIVTASHQDTVSLKLNYVLFKYFPFLSYKDVIITSQKQLIRGDVLVDDAPHNFKEVKCFGILMTAPHNKTYDTLSNGLVRANNWEDIYNIICNYAHKKGYNCSTIYNKTGGD